MAEEKITFISEDKTELVGFLATPNEVTKKCILLCHGLTGNKDEHGIFIELSEALVEKGFSVLRFDFRGHGESGGRSMDMTIQGEKEDVEAAIRMLEAKGYEAFGILGFSFSGGVVSLYIAQDIKKVRTLVLWSPLLDYGFRLDPKTSWGKTYWGQPAIDKIHKIGYTTIGLFRVGKKLVEEMAIVEPWKVLVELALPTLFVHGNKDTVIDYHDSVKYSLLMKNAELEIIRGAEHVYAENDEFAKEAIDKTVAFFQKHL